MDKSFIELGLKKKEGKTDLTWGQIGELFNMSGEEARQAIKRYSMQKGILKGKYESNRTRVLILSDLHIPDHKPDMILDIIKKNSDVHLIILNGDIMDCKAVTGWYDEEYSILDHEIAEAHALLQQIRKLTKANIVLVKGNHEERVNREYAQSAKSLGSAVVETEILYKLANGFYIKTKRGRRVDFPKIKDIYYAEGRTFRYGDLLCNHPSTFRKAYMGTASVMWNDVLKNRYPESKVIVFGHTHQMGMIHIEDGKVLIECGCTCNPASYADKDDKPFKMQQYGYVYLEMVDKEVDIESIKMIHLGNDEIRSKSEDLF